MILNRVLMYVIVNVMLYIPGDGWELVLMVAQTIPIFTLVPRFILNLRELYARDLKGRRGCDIDSAFGLMSASSNGTVASAIVFADAGQNEREGQDEEIQVEESEIRSASSCV